MMSTDDKQDTNAFDEIFWKRCENIHEHNEQVEVLCMTKNGWQDASGSDISA